MYVLTAVLTRGARNTGILLAAAFLAWATMVIVLLLADMVFALAGQGGGSVAIIAFFTLPIWLLGLLTVGGVVWAIAHRLEATGPSTVMAIGAIVAGLCATAVLAVLVPRADAGVLFSQALVGVSAAGGGAVAGRVIWKLAYKRAARP